MYRFDDIAFSNTHILHVEKTQKYGVFGLFCYPPEIVQQHLSRHFAVIYLALLILV